MVTINIFLAEYKLNLNIKKIKIMRIFGNLFSMSFSEYIDLGIKKALERDYSSAFVYFEKAINKNPAHHLGYFNRGAVILESAYIKIDEDIFRGFEVEDQIKEAITDFDKTIRLNPNYTKAYIKRGFAKIMLNDTSSGKADFEHALSHGDSSVLSILNDPAFRKILNIH
ncbi:MAG TPA: hypothetical protein PKI01_10040 [Bacteroidales bacterium]|nr:hypothetical protein [Bacteroidales bacterium]